MVVVVVVVVPASFGRMVSATSHDCWIGCWRLVVERRPRGGRRTRGACSDRT